MLLAAAVKTCLLLHKPGAFSLSLEKHLLCSTPRLRSGTIRIASCPAVFNSSELSSQWATPLRLSEHIVIPSPSGPDRSKQQQHHLASRVLGATRPRPAQPLPPCACLCHPLAISQALLLRPAFPSLHANSFPHLVRKPVRQRHSRATL